MPPWPVLAIALLVGAMALPVQAAPVQLYVASHGDDRWEGSSRDRPFATLHRARDELRARKAAGELREGAVVRVAQGTYRLRETLTLGALDSGTPDAPILWLGDAASKPVLTGGHVLSDWEPYEGAVMRCDLAASGIPGQRFKQLFFAGRRQPLARYPNLDPNDPHGGAWAHVARVQGENNSTTFHYGSDEQHSWAHPEEGSVAIFAGYDWAFGILPIASHDPARREIGLAGTTWCPMRIGDRYVISGLFEELDAPGEWYLDPRTDTVYFWPPDDIAAGLVEAPVLQSVVAIEGASDLEVRGFAIEVCEGDAVRIVDSERCVISASVIRNCGGAGVVIGGGRQSGARGNDVYECGHGGISVSGGNRDTLEPGGNFADNNYVHHCARIWKTYRPGVSVGGVGNTVSHNLIHDMPHAGLLLGGNDNVVEYNVVRHVNLESGDTGGIYFCSRDWTQRGNVIRYNIFHHIGGYGKDNSWAPLANGKVGFSYPHFTWGIYLDDPTTGTLVYGNVLYAVPICALHNHGGRDNVFENNVIVDCPAVELNMLDPNWSEWPAIYDRLRARRYDGSPYLDRYPEIAGIADTRPEEMSGVRFLRNIVYYTRRGGEWLRTQRGGWGGGENTQAVYLLYMTRDDLARNEWDYNCIYAEPGVTPAVSAVLLPGDRRLLDWDEWRALGQDEHSIIADPGFLNLENLDLRLREDSPALALGFQPIPLDRIGPYEDPARASWPIAEAPGAAALGELVTHEYYEPPEFKRVPADSSGAATGIPNVAAKARAGEGIRVAYFGGGRHYADGWRRHVIEWLGEEFGVPVEEIDAGICDCVRGSPFSVYRLEHDVIAHAPDLLLVDFAIDDAHLSPDIAMEAAEGIVRQAWRALPELDIVFVYTFREGFERDYGEGFCPSSISAWERVAQAYGIPSANLAREAAKLFEEGGLVLRPDSGGAGGRIALTAGGLAPTAEMNDFYGARLREFLAKCSREGAPGPHAIPAPLTETVLDRARLAPIAPYMLTGDWTPLDPEDELSRRFSRHFDTIWHTSSPGAKLSFRFRGTAFGIYDLLGPDTGVVRVTCDGVDLGTRTRVDPWSYFHRLSAFDGASGLRDEIHTVTIELLPDPPDRSVAIASAREQGVYRAEDFEGVALRIGWIRLIGELVLPDTVP